MWTCLPTRGDGPLFDPNTLLSGLLCDQNQGTEVSEADEKKCCVQSGHKLYLAEPASCLGEVPSRATEAGVADRVAPPVSRLCTDR